MAVLSRLVVIASLLAAGCSDHAIVKPAYRPVSSLPPGTSWSGGITLVGDDQKFHIGAQTFLFRSGFVDRSFSRTAVRVPQQDLFGDALLALVAGEPGIAVHLGDALDLSCTDEWQDFARIMNGGKRNAWFWTPGNHDGYFFGNFVGPVRQWQAACHPAQPMTKSATIRAYVTAHLAGYAGTQLDPGRGTWACAAGASCRGLVRATWSIEDGASYHRSYIVQEIDVPRSGGASTASLILIDTSTYDRSPRIAPSESMLHYAAGEEGRIGNEQAAVVEQWVAHAVGEGRTVVLAGHHPFDELDEESRAVVNRMVSSRRVATYISAHTHWGTYYTHVGTDGYAWLEPNLGSIIDYDSEYATLSIGFQGSSRFVRMARTTTGSFANGEHADLGIACSNPDWLARPDDPDFYTRYMTSTSPRPGKVEVLYYATMLAALDRYYRCVPTTTTDAAVEDQCFPSAAPCRPDSEVHASILEILASNDLNKIRAKAVELIERDRSRNADPCLRREYKVCQALWAAEFEHREYITPVKGEDTFEIHTARATR